MFESILACDRQTYRQTDMPPSIADRDINETPRQLDVKRYFITAHAKYTV